MAPYSTQDDIANCSNEDQNNAKVNTLTPTLVSPWKYEILYVRVLLYGYWHIAALYGFYLAATSAKWQTLVFAYYLYVIGNLGITAGAHRLWSHRGYKAKMPLQILLMIFNTVAFQYTASNWVRDHRLHHKYSDTDADPHNANRGFFFSHIGWLLVKKHPQVKQFGKTVDMSDIRSNPVLKFQDKYVVPLIFTFTFLLPTLIPMYFWGETLSNSWHICAMLRFVITLNGIFLVNSAAHIWGYKPYDKNIKPVENTFVVISSLGEGFHNYHHTYPWDYRAAELGNNKWNITTKFIDFFAWIGWAYDLKTVSNDVVKTRKQRTGDGSHI